MNDRTLTNPSAPGDHRLCLDPSYPISKLCRFANTPASQICPPSDLKDSPVFETKHTRGQSRHSCYRFRRRETKEHASLIYSYQRLHYW